MYVFGTLLIDIKVYYIRIKTAQALIYFCTQIIELKM